MKPDSTQRKPLPMTAETVLDAVGQAVRQAVQAHAQADNLVAEWRDGKVVLSKPEELKPAAE